LKLKNGSFEYLAWAVIFTVACIVCFIDSCCLKLKENVTCWIGTGHKSFMWKGACVTQLTWTKWPLSFLCTFWNRCGFWISRCKTFPGIWNADPY
jgi:hypothetical protein